MEPSEFLFEIIGLAKIGQNFHFFTVPIYSLIKRIKGWLLFHKV